MLTSLPCTLTRIALPGALLSVFLAHQARAQSPAPSICPPVQVVFTLDTSRSMRDESRALCDTIQQVKTELLGQGIEASSTIWSITDHLSDPDFSCLQGSVAAELETTVPGEPGSCSDTLGPQDIESWGPATAIVAQHFPWAENAVRVIVPISDEAACQGSPCLDEEDEEDAQATRNAIEIAKANNVIVSPILGTDVSNCAANLALDTAKETGGKLFVSKDPRRNFSEILTQIVQDACVTALSCQLSPGPKVTKPGEQNQFTIEFREENQPAPNSRVELRTLSGPNADKITQGRTSENGQAVLGYLGKTRGVDQLNAVCIDSTGREQASASSELHFWDSDCDENGVADRCDLSCSNFEEQCQAFPTCGEGIDADTNNRLDICEREMDPHDLCGNGLIDYCEDCDDGNRVNGDGCSSTCMFEHKGWPKRPSIGDKFESIDDRIQSVRDRLDQMSQDAKERLRDKRRTSTSKWRQSR